MSPPRERKQGGVDQRGRNYSWAAQRIHELEKDNELLKHKLKENEKLMREQLEMVEASSKLVTALRQEKAELQVRGCGSRSGAPLTPSASPEPLPMACMLALSLSPPLACMLPFSLSPPYIRTSIKEGGYTHVHVLAEGL